MKLRQIGVLVIAGMLVGEVHPGLLTETLRAAVLIVFLPALIFEAAWNLDLELMRRFWRPILLLAVPGVLVTAALIAFCATHFAGVTLAPALLLGAILSATDPIAVVAIFRRLRIPEALATIVESEALLNDGVAVVLYRATILGLLAGVTPGGVALLAAQSIAGSMAAILAGICVAIVIATLLRRRMRAGIQFLATILGAFGVYAFAERLGWSGIFAVIAFGIALRALERRSLTRAVARGVERLWHRIATVANLMLFFLVGAAVELRHVLFVWPAILATLAAVLLARVLLANGLLRLVPHLEHAWRVVIRVAGVRGALSLALALALAPQIPGRDMIISVVYAVVVITTLLGAFASQARIAAIGFERG